MKRGGGRAPPRRERARGVRRRSRTPPEAAGDTGDGAAGSRHAAQPQRPRPRDERRRALQRTEAGTAAVDYTTTDNFSWTDGPGLATSTPLDITRGLSADNTRGQLSAADRIAAVRRRINDRSGSNHGRSGAHREAPALEIAIRGRQQTPGSACGDAQLAEASSAQGRNGAERDPATECMQQGRIRGRRVSPGRDPRNVRARLLQRLPGRDHAEQSGEDADLGAAPGAAGSSSQAPPMATPNGGLAVTRTQLVQWLRGHASASRGDVSRTPSRGTTSAATPTTSAGIVPSATCRDGPPQRPPAPPPRDRAALLRGLRESGT